VKMKLKGLMWRVGHRGAFLLFLSLLDFLYGYSLFSTARQGSHLDLILSLTAWGVIWVAVGAVLLVGSFVKKDQIPYGLAATIKAAWACAWVKMWLFFHAMPLAWVSVVIWSAFSAIVVIVSTWPEDRRRKRVKTVQSCIEIPVIDDEEHVLLVESDDTDEDNTT